MVGVDVTRRDRLHAEVLGEITEKCVAPRVPSLERPLELDVESIRPKCGCKRRGRIRVDDSQPTPGAAGEANKSLGELQGRLERDPGREWFPVFFPRPPRSGMGGGEQAAEIPIAASALNEQRDMSTTLERDFRARDRSHPECLRRVRELERAVDAVVIGERESLVSELRCASGELLRLRRPVQKAVRGVTVELDVSAHVSGAPLAKEASARSVDSTRRYGHATSAKHPAASGVSLRRSPALPGGSRR
jgi:hypothetical protein